MAKKPKKKPMPKWLQWSISSRNETRKSRLYNRAKRFAQDEAHVLNMGKRVTHADRS